MPLRSQEGASLQSRMTFEELHDQKIWTDIGYPGGPIQ